MILEGQLNEEMKRLKKIMMTVTMMLLCSMLFAGIASAHVTVFPQQATQGAYEKFTLRVPSEKDMPTMKVEVKIPTDVVAVSRFEPKDGWKYDLTKDDSGKIIAVTWTSTGNGLSKTEFAEFNMSGKVADGAQAIVWKAYQTYQDGSVVEWVGAEGSEKPASITKVIAKAAGAAGGHDAMTPAAGGKETAQNAGQSNLPLYLSIAALVLGALAFVNSLRRRKA